MVRRKLARCFRQAPLLVESFTDESKPDREPDRRKKRKKALQSGKVRTAHSSVVKRITLPHELIYISGIEPVMYDLISMSQFMTGYLSVLDTVKQWVKQVMFKHPKELVADASTYE